MSRPACPVDGRPCSCPGASCPLDDYARVSGASGLALDDAAEIARRLRGRRLALACPPRAHLPSLPIGGLS